MVAFHEYPEADWTITWAPGSEVSEITGYPRARAPETVRAVYVTCSDGLPGWTILKNAAKQIVRMVRTDAVLSVDRTPDVPDPLPEPPKPFVGEDLPGGEDPAQVIAGLAAGAAPCQPGCTEHRAHANGVWPVVTQAGSPVQSTITFRGTYAAPNMSLTVSPPPIPMGCICSYTAGNVRNGPVAACPADHTDLNRYHANIAHQETP